MLQPQGGEGGRVAAIGIEGREGCCSHREGCCSHRNRGEGGVLQPQGGEGGVLQPQGGEGGVLQPQGGVLHP